MLKKIQSILEKFIKPVADFCDSNIYLLSIREGFLPIIPLFLISSLFVLICDFPIWNYINPNINKILWQVFRHPHTVVSSFIGIFTLIGISYSCSIRKKIDPIYGVITALISFFVITKMELLFKGEIIKNIIKTSDFGSSSLFTSIIIALLSVSIFAFCLDKNINIRISDKLPDSIITSFGSIIPLLITIMIFATLSSIVAQTKYLTVMNLINILIGSPFMNVVGNPIGMIFLYTCRNFFWFFGINGGMVLLPFTEPLIQTMTAQNLEAVANNLPLPNVISLMWMFAFKGNALVVVLIILAVSKSQRLKSIGKFTFIPSLFNVTDAITFGLPMILNPYMMIPFLLSIPIEYGLSYFLIKMGMCSIPSVMIPWTTPPLLNSFLATNYDFKAVIVQLIVFSVVGAIYLPFIIMQDKAYLKDEAKANLSQI